MSNLGDKIKELRRLKGLTQEDLANLSTVNLRTIQRIENKESQPRGKTLILICDALNIEIEALLLQDKNTNNEDKSDFNNDVDKKDNKFSHANNLQKDIVFGYRLASRGTRFLATLIEGVILMVMFFIPFLIFRRMSFKHFMNLSGEPVGIILWLIISLVLGALLYPYLIGNLGHSIFNLKVISSETGEDYNKASKGAMREFSKHILSYLIIPVIWILWDSKKQNLYDKFSKTYVVEKNN